MNRSLILAMALALAFAGDAAADDGGGGDNGMSRWNGDSHSSFAAASKQPGGTKSSAAEAANIQRAGENSMSRWNGDSYAAFEQARTSTDDVTVGIAEANKARAAALREAPARTATRARTPANAFRDDTAG